jgi:hypothetical protein
MKASSLFLAFVLVLLSPYASGQWSLPVQITDGPDDDSHPSFANSAFGTLYNGEEWIAFSRKSSIGSSICLMKTRDLGLHWVDTVYSMTDDSAGNDFPTLARTKTWYGETRMMLLWQGGRSPSRIWYAFNRGSVWSAPSPLTGDSSSEISPHVVPIDTGFGAVWEHKGRIAFAEFVNNAWTPPVFITSPEDSGNCLPQLSYIGFLPWVLWEKTKPGESAHRIMHSLRWDSTWSAPDTLAQAGDNRNPRFSKPAFPGGSSWISYESNLTGDWEIYGNEAHAPAGSIEWFGPVENLSQNPLADDRHASFMSVPMITDAHAPQNPFYALAGTWAVESGGSDSILVSRGLLARSYITVAPGTTDRNPEISCGVLSSVLRVWSVWENNATGVWKLYGSCTDIVVDVDREESIAGSFRLHQNYPNPFNSSTNIKYELPKASQVTLSVFDILGREVSVLVNERREAGVHEVKFDASGLSSGVYFYRIQTGTFVETKRLLLIR